MDNQITIDGKDREILACLQQDARISNAEIARALGMAPSATLERLRKLEQRGIVTGYEARISPPAVGAGLLAFVFIKTEERVGESPAAEALAELPEVQELHHIAGEDCYLAKVRVADTEALGRLLREKLGGIGTVSSTRSTIVLNTFKETARLTLASPEAAEEMS